MNPSVYRVLHIGQEWSPSIVQCSACMTIVGAIIISIVKKRKYRKFLRTKVFYNSDLVSKAWSFFQNL